MRKGGLVPPFFRLYFSNLYILILICLDTDIYSLLSTFSMYSVIIPLTIGLFRRKYFNSGEKILLYLVGLSALADFGGSILQMQNINNMYVFHIYTVIEFSVISLFYIKIIPNRRLTYFVIALMSLFLCVAVYDYINNKDQMDDLSTSTESIIVIFYAVLGFSSLLRNPVQSRVIAIPLFWLNTALLLYFAGNLFLFIFSNYMQQHYKGEFRELWGIHSIMSILFYLLMSTGFWKTKAR
jgi:hypothetical protein